MNPIIQEANLPKALELILIIFIVYYAFKFIMQFVLPTLLRKYVNDFQKQFTKENQHSQDEMNRKKEGEVSIKFVDKDKNKSQHTDDGEYVDYEEIK